MGIVRRKRYLINPGLQLTVIGFNLILALGLILIFYVATSYLFSKFTGMDTAAVINDPIIAEMIDLERSRLNMILGLSSIAILFVMVLGGMILSNRIAGPIYRIRRHMLDLLDGKQVPDLKFRKNDFFPELADTYNDLLKKLKK